MRQPRSFPRIRNPRTRRAGRAAVCCFLGLVAIAFLGDPAHAQPYPHSRLTRVFPAGAQAGATTEVTLDGADLDDVTAMYFSHPDIKAQRVPDPKPQIDPKTKKPKKTPPAPIRFKVTVPADTPLGNHDVRVAGKWGISNPRAFAVGKLPEAVETEPNDDVPQAQKIELNSTVNGTIAAKTDVDYFAFAGKKGERVVFRCAGWSIDSKLGPMMELYDGAGRLLATKYRIQGDLVMDAMLPADGTFWLRVCQFAYVYGGVDSYYRLTISRGPWIDAVYPPVVAAGATTAVTVYGRNLPSGKPGPNTVAGRPLDAAVVQVAAPARASDEWTYRGLHLPKSLGLDAFEFRAKSPVGPSNPVLLTFADDPIVLENDANNTRETAQRLTLPCEVCGRVEKRGDRDWFAFGAKKGEAVIAECFADRLGAPMDMVMQIWRADPPQLLTEFDDHADLPAAVGQFFTRTEDPKGRWVAPADGTYFLRATSRTADMRGGPRFIYRLSLRRERPDFHVAVIENPDSTTAGFTLQRGGRQHLGVLCLRDDGFHGEVLLEAEGLPPGVACAPQIVGPDAVESALVLRCAANAPLRVGTIKIKATATIDGKKVVRHARTGTVIWPNPQRNVATHSRLTRALYLSVVEPGPFTLDAPVKEIAAPVGGKVEIKVRAQRRGDFKALVALTRVAGPVQPGGKAIAIPNVNIAPNQSEGTVRFQLPGNTPAGTYNVVFQGKGKHALVNPKDKKKRNVDFLAASPPVALIVFDKAAALTLAKTEISLKPGAKAALPVAIKRLHQFNGPVKVELVPPGGSQGITAAVLTIPAGKNEGQLVVQAPKNAKPGAYADFIVRASAKVDTVTLKDEAKVRVAVINAAAADGKGAIQAQGPRERN